MVDFIFCKCLTEHSSKDSNRQNNYNSNSIEEMHLSAQDSTADRTNGRWTAEEHQKFMQGLKMYGKNWKKLEEVVGTRNGSQIRSHAQKYFMKTGAKNEQRQQDVENMRPKSQEAKFKEITVQKDSNTNKKVLKPPRLESPYFWQQVSNMLRLYDFSFWDLVQIQKPTQRPPQATKNSFTSYEAKTPQALDPIPLNHQSLEPNWGN